MTISRLRSKYFVAGLDAGEASIRLHVPPSRRTTGSREGRSERNECPTIVRRQPSLGCVHPAPASPSSGFCPDTAREDFQARILTCRARPAAPPRRWTGDNTLRYVPNPRVNFSDQMTQRNALAIVCGHGFAVICRMTMQPAVRADRIVFGVS